ncbi:MAG: 50S ribosomal protein L21 [Nitrospiraceae bacterium]|nr:50S ribosomal protein L21 [Nitrospiraceae bacterium]
MLTVIKTGGKQYLVSPGDKIKVEKLDAEKGKKITFDQVLLTSDEDGKDAQIGQPFLDKASVEGKVLRQFRDKKVTIIKHKAKKRYNLKKGHRQCLTEVEIVRVK